MRIELNRDRRNIKLWTNPEHSYELSFRHPQYQTWWVCLSEEWWNIKPVSYGLKPSIEFARVIWAR